MNNIEQNALRIAELRPTYIENVPMGKKILQSNVRCIEIYSSYNGLMPIVFECNKSDDYSLTMTSNCVHLSELHTMKPMKDKLNNYKIGDTEPEFIEALQECVIKYLELQND